MMNQREREVLLAVDSLVDQVNNLNTLPHYKFFKSLETKLKAQNYGDLFCHLEPGKFSFNTPDISDEFVDELSTKYALLIVNVYNQTNREFGRYFAEKVLTGITLTF